MTDIKKAIEQLDMFIEFKRYYEQGYNVRQPPELLFPALELALQALKEKAERDTPKPLTLDELLERIDKPVWCEDSETWGLVVEDRRPIKECGKLFFCFYDSLGISFEWSIKKRNLKLYDHEPKGE